MIYKHGFDIIKHLSEFYIIEQDIKLNVFLKDRLDIFYQLTDIGWELEKLNIPKPKITISYDLYRPEYSMIYITIISKTFDIGLNIERKNIITYVVKSDNPDDITVNIFES